MQGYAAEAVKAINEKTNELLLKYDNCGKNPAIDPSVNIMKIANGCGVKDVIYVPSEQLKGKHADYKDGVVRIDENDAEGQRQFDLAHEVGHIVFNHFTSIEYKISRPGGGMPLVVASVDYEAARHGTRKKSELPPGEREIEDFFDRFAANLLIPINRFQLWEDKTDKEIADAFKVEESCIKKRRQEVEYEINILTAEMKPCPIEAVINPDVKLDIDTMLGEINS